MLKCIQEEGARSWKSHFSAQVLAYLRKNVIHKQCIKLGTIFLIIFVFDVGEGTQHQILHHSIKLGR